VGFARHIFYMREIDNETTSKVDTAAEQLLAYTVEERHVD